MLHAHLTSFPRFLSIALLAVLIAVSLAFGQSLPSAKPTERPAPPTRDPHTPSYVTAKELPDSTNPPADADGNFILGPTHNPAPEMSVKEGVPQGTVINLTMASADSKIYPGIARDAGTFGTPDPANPAKLNVTTSHPAPYTRRVAVYVPKQYVAGSTAPFIVGADGPDTLLFTALDNLIANFVVTGFVERDLITVSHVSPKRETTSQTDIKERLGFWCVSRRRS